MQDKLRLTITSTAFHTGKHCYLPFYKKPSVKGLGNWQSTSMFSQFCYLALRCSNCSLIQIKLSIQIQCMTLEQSAPDRVKCRAWSDLPCLKACVSSGLWRGGTFLSVLDTACTVQHIFSADSAVYIYGEVLSLLSDWKHSGEDTISASYSALRRRRGEGQSEMDKAP